MEITIKQLDEKEFHKLGIKNWPIWEKEISKFSWNYENEEQCYFIEGDATVLAKGNIYKIKKGDFVIFPKGLSTRWVILEPVKKHYKM
ncbi:MAG: cupin [Bacteroidetes bacterium GWA2_32_17]|nr:MAG: cupin [Bacteroidetes bacterium GWA2_32_17]